MAPALTTELPAHFLSNHHELSTKDKAEDTRSGGAVQDTSFPKPLKLSGALEHFQVDDLTPAIGREFINVNIVDDILNAANADALLRDLAITISQRGVVLFRAQSNLTDSLQKSLVHSLGQLTNKPSTHTVHIHPVLNNTSEFGVADAEISRISSVARKSIFRHEAKPTTHKRYDAAAWHSDIQFEVAPADYTSLRLTKLPSTGGDTLYASGYEIYERFSKPYQKLFEGLTATFSGDGFIRAEEADPERVKLYEQPRGSPLNVGRELKTVHPVVRTNPVTGWKSIYAVGTFPKVINELAPEESDELLKKFKETITTNHDLQVRIRWKNENDIAIWDNRSTFHAATFDYDHLGERFGNRAVGIGEQPYFDPHSKSRSEALAADI